MKRRIEAGAWKEFRLNPLQEVGVMKPEPRRFAGRYRRS